MKSIKEEIEKLVDKLADARREYDRLAFDEEEPQELGAPAPPARIAAFEKKLGITLPPSYRAFLELHDGWAEFDGEAKLLAIEDQDSAWVKKRTKALGEHFAEEDEENPFEAGCVPIMVGPTERNFAVLDPRKPRKDGEMDIVTYDLAEEEDRFKDFAAYLKDQLKVTKELIDEERSGESEED